MLGAITVEKNGGAKVSAPTYVDRLSFTGDNSYPTGGTEDFEGKVRTKIGDNRTILGIFAEDCGAYRPVYDNATDRLKVYVTADGLQVGNGVDLSGTTFKVVVLSK